MASLTQWTGRSGVHSPRGRKESDTTERLNGIACLIAAITECHTVSGLRKTQMIYLTEIEAHRANNM